MPAKRTTASPAAAVPAPKLSSGPKTLTANSSVYDIAYHVWEQYLATTSQRTMLLDAFMAFLVLVGGIQFVYCVLAGNFVRFLTPSQAAAIRSHSSPPEGKGEVNMYWYNILANVLCSVFV
ncbi:conserved hypothetical protein [Aspergillus terreus NIH2624]|jgi:hypothetical protein|uniref:Dolichyl-diphosphooligosaccharide--protein glycosyltransferase subunit OST2 n=1 Tax=Aspergillus terreus (strain NIH 2624 / FGSC A1156) TaxID=341663 RepID=Q0CR54_ASPTN|nr:uncharacterized protein ATEG_03830 [Aspergillus terreus NIH2624]EAU35632.1 conserved hypothetical protein [Aspergillus terreus NIH2624]